MTTPEQREAASAAPPGQQRGRIPADTFSNRLLLARAMAGLTVQEAAIAAGLDRSSWQNWERGRRPRDFLDACQRIALALDVDEYWLVFGGPLTSARGRPARREVTPDTVLYPVGTRERSHERPSDNRPSGRADSILGPTRRLVETHPAATGPRRSRRISDRVPPASAGAPITVPARTA